jgi:hypothetical protein
VSLSGSSAVGAAGEVVSPPGNRSRATSRLAPLFRRAGWPVAATGCLAIVTLLVFYRQLFQYWTFPWDFLGTYSTTPAYVAATVGHGHFLSWSPFVASGFPVSVNPQAELYFPGWWLAGILNIPLTLGAVTDVQVVHVLFGSIGMLALARARKLGWPWALAAAMAYLFFGGFYGESEHADIFRGFAYLPWLLWSLTPPSGERWWRLAALPPLIWLIVSGAYPGQLVSFGIIGAIYLAVAMRASGRALWQRYRGALILAVASAGAVCVAVDLPYLLANHAHELYRAELPTAAVRAGESTTPLDFLGLYLNPFAWQYDGTVTSWAIGVPVLIGLACIRRSAWRRHRPLLIAGLVGLALAMTPKIGFIGHAMASLSFLFPSRFPAADYKAVVAIAAIVLAVESWSEIASRRRKLPLAAVVGAVVLGIGALIAPTNWAPATEAPALLAIVIVATAALALLRPKPALLVSVLLTLIVVDGVREIRDDKLKGQDSSWQVVPADAIANRDLNAFIRKLPQLAVASVPSRPARVRPAESLSVAPTGSNSDAAGWVADGYHLVDYSGTIESVLRRAERSPTWRAQLLAPWRAYVFPCSSVGCTGSVRLPNPSGWRVSPSVHTVAYGAEGITYDVDVHQPVLMVENELALKGWQSNSPHARLVNAGIPLRAWRLAPGRYQFTATYHQAGRGLQELAVVAALLLWLGAGAWIYRRPRLPISARKVSYSRM